MSNSVEEWLKNNKALKVPFGVSGRITKKQKIKAWKQENKKPIQKPMSELVKELKAKTKKRYYNGDEPPWD